MKLSKTFSVWALALLAAFTCFTINLQGAVPIGATQTFSGPAAPPAGDWATVSLPVNDATFADDASMDLAVQTNTQANISTALPTVAGVGQNALARWDSTGLQIYTRPTGNGATLLKATLINNSASVVSTLTVSYDQNMITPGGDTPTGRQVYYNMDGSANSWVLIPALSGDGTVGNKTGTVDLSATPLAAGGTMYLLWADDNSTGGTDPAYTIDNFLADVPGNPPTVTDPTPATLTVLQCRTASFSVQAGGSPPLTIQWLKDGSPIDTGANPSAATSTLVISNAQAADAASYRAQVSNSGGTVTSTGAGVLTVTPDNAGPTLVYAIGQGDMTTVMITFNEPLSDTATDNFNYSICNADESDCLGLQSATLSADRMTVTWTTTARTPGVSYNVFVRDITDACVGNLVIPESSIALNTEVPVLLADATTQWKYNQDGVDQGTTWKDTLFNDSGWSNGLAALAVEDTPPADPALRTVLSLTNGPFNTATTELPTYYFRTHFNFPGDPTSPSARLKIRTAFDDYGYVYINGVEVYRDPFLGAVGSAELAFTAYTGGTAIGSYGWGAYINVPLTSVVQGDNVVAVQLKQQANNSSDIGMALEIVAELPAVVDECPTITDQPDSLTVNELSPASFSVTANGTSLQYEWQKDGTPIVGANQRTYSIPVARPSHNGVYRVRVFNNCAGVNSVLSDPATLTVTPKTTRPGVASALGLVGQTNIVINFSNGPLSTASAQNVNNYSVSGGVTVQSAVLSANGSQVTLTTTARTIGNNYSLTISGVTDDAQTPNLINPNPTVINPLAQELRLIDWHHVWKYDANCQDGTGWEQPLFDDSAWASGPAVLGVETTAATLTFLTNTTGDGVLTPITAPNAGGANNHYFRTHVTLPTIDLTAVTWDWNNVRDDGAILYMNGAEVWRRNITNAAGMPVVCLDQAQSNEADALSSPNDAPTAARGGDNVIAVYLKQNGTNSSDIVWALEVVLTVAEYRAPRPQLCISNDALPNGSRVVTVATCPGSPSAVGYRLQHADDLTGPWTDVPGNPNPYVQTNPALVKKFYRLCQGICP